MLTSRSEETASPSSGIGGMIRGLRGSSEDGRNNRFGYLFIAPALILYLIFNVWPLFRGITMAFTDYRFIYPNSRWSFNGLKNFTDMAKDKTFWDSLGVAGKYTLLVLPTMIILALLLAVTISKVQRGVALYRWIIYLPAILPIAVTYLMFGEIYGFQFGFINSVLRNWGVATPPNWLGDVRYVLPSIAAADLWRGIGFPTLLFLIGIYTINGELYEAAAIDGATVWQQFWRITLPLLKPSLSLVFILNIGIIGVTEPMLILTNGGPQNATRTVGFYLYQVAFRFGDLRLGYAAAVSLVIGLTTALISLIVFRLLRER